MTRYRTLDAIYASIRQEEAADYNQRCALAIDALRNYAIKRELGQLDASTRAFTEGRLATLGIDLRGLEQ